MGSAGLTDTRACLRFRIRLGVNIDHVATIRNARGGRASRSGARGAELAIEAGADGITAHLREDRRHIRDDDMARLKAEISKPLNFEMAATAGDDRRSRCATKPHAVCLVPERREELTTEGGLDVAGQHNALAPFIAQLERCRHPGVAVHRRRSARRSRWRRSCGAPVIEIHTGAWCDAVVDGHAGEGGSRMAAHRRGRGARALGSASRCMPATGSTMRRAETIAALPEIVELNIGYLHDRRGDVRRPRRDGSQPCARRWIAAARGSDRGQR